ncbi:uncharacterized protein LOC134565166 isoform X1 [Prinia subflava]|uniref:uncharacterized protein LOC134565166 isoform X1 n=1 Tax=Prinia subflava TaxID=208062 RepID=UPI002FE3E70F
MEAIAKVVSVIHRQWEIECKPRDLQLALARLLELGVIERPVEILHSEVWGRCTLALAEDTESTGSGKHLKAWGRVKQSLRKALEEQETWSAARVCLLATPKLGVGATTQTAFENDLSECEKPREPSTLPPSRSPSPKSPVPSGNPPTPTPSPSASPPPAEPSRASGGPSSVPLPSIGGSVPEARQRGRFFWQGLAEEARDAEHVAQESTRPAPPPYGFENGAGGSGEGRGLNVCGGESPEPWVCASAHAQGKAGEEGEKCVLGQEPRASAGACAQQEGRGCMFGAAPRVPAGACAPGSGGESAPGPAPWASAGACAPGGGGEGAFGEAPPFPADVHTRESRGERPRSSEPWFSADPHARDSGEERVRASGPRFPAGTHVREGREEHVSRRELRSALPAFRGETSPRKRQGKPRGREQSHPREGGRERSHPREGGRERSHPREGGRERSHPREGGREWSHPREGGREWSHPREEGRGRSRTERHSNPEVSWQCVSDSLSDSTGGSSSGEQTESDWDSETKRAEPTRFKMKPNKAFSHSKKSLQHEPAQVTDWGKIKIACAEWTPASTVKAFPVRVARIEDNQQKIYTPVNPKDIQTIVKAIPEKRNEPRAPKCPTPVRPRQQRCFCMILLLGLVARMQASPDYYPHQPFRWVMKHLSNDKVLKEITTPGTPSFVFHITDLFPGRPKIDRHAPHLMHMYMAYWCPASNPGKRYCNYPGWGHCGYWGCETIVTDARPSGYGWDPQEPDKFLQFSWAPTGCNKPFFRSGFYRNYYQDPTRRTCTDYNMTVLQPDHPSWATGRTWTVVLQSPKEWVNVQIIRLQPPVPRAVGPKEIIRDSQKGKSTIHPKSLPTKVTNTPTSYADAFQIDHLAVSDPNPIFRMLEATFSSLNESNPNLTNPCWLCYDVKPPFYEGVALNIPFSYSTADVPHQCRWDTPRRGITLSQVTGQGKCFGSATLAKQKGNVCTEVVKPDKKINKWVIPAASGMWVCQRSGVSPCVSLAKFNDSDDFCIQVLIVPRVLYRSDEEVCQLSEEPGRLHKREIITGVTIAMLLGLGAAGTATGVSALVTQHQGLSQLQVTIDEDLQRIEKSISFLEKSVSSLSEVVLQNRRGLDLLFMQQGGLCAALKEECCFYADHTGVVRDSMAELRDRLAQKKKDREAQQGWFESWFNQSPWLTTLISTLIGPLAMLLLALAIGPCLLNKLVTFIQTRLERANILFVGQQQLL